MLFSATGDGTCAAKDSKEKSLVISSGCESLGGVTIFINRHAIKIQPKTFSAYIVAKEPDWRVVVFNPSSGNGMEMPYKDWLVHRMQISYLYYPKDTGNDYNFFPAGKRVVEGFTCERLGCIRNNEKRDYAPDREYLVLKNDLANVKACRVLASAMSTPQYDAVPISFTVTRKDRSTQMLKTTKIEEKIVPASFFTYPKTYKKCKNEYDVLHEGRTDRMMENVFGQ